jgi:hypothetical protein
VADLFAELKRRKVIRVAVVYAATAFAVLQAADIMLPQMNVPEWAMGLLVALVVFGFPIALVLAWALELTPGGLKRTESAPAAQAEQGPAPALLGKRTVFAAGTLGGAGRRASAPAGSCGRLAGRTPRRPGRRARSPARPTFPRKRPSRCCRF